jgi:DNA segregation ATPase FtsK/SpoIIIE, S-DNA-T family
MLEDKIIGRVAASILSQRLSDARQADGALPDSAALFRLDKLASNQIAAIVREILSNLHLRAEVDVRIPAALVTNEGLPPEALTELNAGPCATPAPLSRHF